jgi:exonuclease VII small subunit
LLAGSACGTVAAINLRASTSGWRQRLVRAWTGFSLAASCLAAETPAIPDYAVGDTADADIVTPIPLVVFDAARTETLRRAEAQKVPPIFRFDPRAGDKARRDLQAAFADARQRFAAGLERLVGHGLPLLAAELADAPFGAFVAKFRAENPRLPLTDPLAELWALGDGGDIALNGWREPLRRLAAAHVRDDALPPGERLVTGTVRLITVEPLDATVTLTTVDQRGKNLARTNLIPLSRLRQDAWKSAPADEQDTMAFAAGFLRPNCFFDEDLTRQARARRIEPINAADRYAAGQRLVSRGEVIDAKMKLALDELRTRLAGQQARAGAVRERSGAEVPAAASGDGSSHLKGPWMTAAGGGAVAIILVMAWSSWRRQRAVVRGALDSSPAVLAPGGESGENADWRERALAAEARAQKATALLQGNLLPHLARWMVGQLMRRLLSQRADLQTNQQQAEREVAQLAERLEQLHAPLEDRLRAYEQRIAELEVELAAKGEQHLDLIQAKIETTRKKLHGERSQESDPPLNWN